MPNLSGLNIDDAAKRLNDLQLEDLGLSRREEIITSETPANSFFVPIDRLQASRRANQPGTKDAKAVRGKDEALARWNMAWTTLKDDGTAEGDLEDVGTGYGQTHRHRLLEDPAVQLYFEGTPPAGFGGRGRGKSARGNVGGAAASRGGFKVRSALEPSPTVTRKRVVKPRGSDAPGPPATKASRKRNGPADLRNPGADSTLYDELINAQIREPQTKRRHDASMAAISFQRQERQYAQTPLSDPALFMASTVRPKTLSENAKSAVATDRAARVKLPASMTSSSTSTRASDAKSKHPGPLADVTNTVPSSLSTVSPARASTATALSETESVNKPVNQASIIKAPQQSQAAMPAPTQSSLLDVLPALQRILSADAYGEVERLVSEQTGQSVAIGPSRQVSEPDVGPSAVSAQINHAESRPTERRDDPTLDETVLLPTVKSPEGGLSGQVTFPTSNQPSHSSLVNRSVGDNQETVQKVISRRIQTPASVSAPPETASIFSAELTKWVASKNEGRCQCMIPGCKKTFKNKDFWRMHVGNKHTEWLDQLEKDTTASIDMVIQTGVATGGGVLRDQIAHASVPQASRMDIIRPNDSAQATGGAKQAPSKVPTSPTTPPARIDEASMVLAPTAESQLAATKAPITLGAKVPQAATISGSQPPRFKAAPSTVPQAVFTSPSRASSSTAPSSARDSRRSLADSLARQREALIGEQVYKARYQPTGPLSDKTTNSPPSLATSNPFGPRRTSTVSTSSTILPSVSEISNTFSTDPGAAARLQYGGLKLDIPPSQPARRQTTSAFSSDSPGSATASQPRPRITPAKGTGPSLPAFLQGTQSSTSTTATSALNSSAPPRITPASGSGPSLPAFLQGATASADTGEAVRQQYGARGRQDGR